jgi:hypothetical protein
MLAVMDETNVYWFHPQRSRLRPSGRPVRTRRQHSGPRDLQPDGVILDIRLPSVLYKKLLSQTVGLDDLADIKPVRPNRPCSNRCCTCADIMRVWWRLVGSGCVRA